MEVHPMERSTVTVKGQIVIPAKLRHKFGIKKGTQVYLYEKGGEIVVQPITDEYLLGVKGMTGTGGKLLKALKEEKAREKKL